MKYKILNLAAFFCALFALLAAVGMATDAQAATAKAYCWKTTAGYYFCYGPTQQTSAGERDVDQALGYAGCADPSLTNYWSDAVGVCRGGWYQCNGRKLESYDNSPSKISDWVNSRKC